MPTLQFIVDNKDYIKNVASKLGIQPNIKLTSYKSDELMLVIETDQEFHFDNVKYPTPHSMFQLWLTYKFETLFFVISAQQKEPGILKELVDNSVSIDNSPKLVELFRKDLKNIEFDEAYVDDDSDLEYTIPKIINLLGEKLAKHDLKKDKINISSSTPSSQTDLAPAPQKHYFSTVTNLKKNP